MVAEKGCGFYTETKKRMSHYLLWASPTLAVALTIACLRWSATRAALLGVLVTLPVSLFTGPIDFSVHQLADSALRGIWIGATIAPYILGGLLFWRVGSMTAGQDEDVVHPATTTSLARRRRLFFACFLIGPFAEAATGFGVGMVGTVMMVRHLRVAPKYVMVFALLSQTMIPWGAMASGSLLGAAYVRASPTEFALHAFVPMAALMVVWMTIFWVTLRRANELSSFTESVREVLWIAGGLSALAVATYVLGPETALLAAYSPLIVLRYFLNEPFSWPDVRKRATACLPFVLIIGWLATTRLVPDLRLMLSTTVRFVPYPDLPALTPLMHAGLWFIVAAVLTAGARGQTRDLSRQVRSAWGTGRQAVWTVFLFAVMAEMLAKSGVAQGLASGLFNAFGTDAILLIPSISGALGVLTNSGNPGNSLLLPPLAALAAQANMNVLAIAAIQHVSGMALGIFSPVRMSIAATLAGGAGEERGVYRFLVPYAVASFVAMTVLAWGATKVPP